MFHGGLKEPGSNTGALILRQDVTINEPYRGTLDTAGLALDEHGPDIAHNVLVVERDPDWDAEVRWDEGIALVENHCHRAG